MEAWTAEAREVEAEPGAEVAQVASFKIRLPALAAADNTDDNTDADMADADADADAADADMADAASQPRPCGTPSCSLADHHLGPCSDEVGGAQRERRTVNPSYTESADNAPFGAAAGAAGAVGAGPVLIRLPAVPASYP